MFDQPNLWRNLSVKAQPSSGIAFTLIFTVISLELSAQLGYNAYVAKSPLFVKQEQQKLKIHMCMARKPSNNNLLPS